MFVQIQIDHKKYYGNIAFYFIKGELYETLTTARLGRVRIFIHLFKTKTDNSSRHRNCREQI